MKKFMTYVGFFAGSLFILFGTAFIFSDILPSYLPTQFKVIAGIVFILYGLYRIVMTVNKKSRADEENI